MWELDYIESWAQTNWCFWTVVLEKTLASPLDCKEIQQVQRKSVLSVNLKDWCWSWNSNTLATWCEELTHLKIPWCWERLRAGEEADDRGWDGWMASPTQWAWVWVSSGSWWWTGRLGMLQSMGSQRVGHDWATELNWTELNHFRIWNRVGRREDLICKQKCLWRAWLPLTDIWVSFLVATLSSVVASALQFYQSHSLPGGFWSQLLMVL